MIPINLLRYFGGAFVDLTLTRAGAGTYTDAGDWTRGSGTTTTIQGISPQPVQANEISITEPGERITDYLKTYTTADVRTRTGTQDADIIGWNGQTYKVHAVDNRRMGGYLKVILRRANT